MHIQRLVESSIVKSSNNLMPYARLAIQCRMHFPSLYCIQIKTINSSRQQVVRAAVAASTNARSPLKIFQMSDSGDEQQRAEEATTLEAIYGEDVEYAQVISAYRVYLPSKLEQAAVLRVLCPPNYPSAAGPVMELEAAAVPAQQLSAAVKHMEDMYCPGQVCLFDCIEWLREQLQRWQDDAAALDAAAASVEQLGLNSSSKPGSSAGSSEGGEWVDDDEEYDDTLQQLPEAATSQPRDRGQTDADSDLIEQMRPKIISGEPFTERKSTFQAHVAPISHVDQVKAVVAVLLESNKIRNATHNIMAYRIAVPDRPGVFHQDYDDDGEAAAGGRLLHLLQVADVRNAVVVVSRWFGGILLGPARFGLINNTARQLLEQTGFIQHSNTGSGSSSSGKQAGKKHQRKKHT